MRRPRLKGWEAHTILVLSLLAPWPVMGQVAGGGGILIQRYAFQDPAVIGLKDFQLVTSPFSAAIPVTGFLSVQLSGAYARGEATGP